MGLKDLFFFIHEYSSLFINIILVQSFPFLNFQSFELRNYIFPLKNTSFLVVQSSRHILTIEMRRLTLKVNLKCQGQILTEI